MIFRLFLITCLLMVWHVATLLANENEKQFDVAYINKADGFKVRSYVEGMYSQEFAQAGKSRFNASPYYGNQYDISYAFVDFTFRKDRFKSTVAVHHGSLVEELYQNENELWKQFREITGEYFVTENLGLEFGNMPSHYGYEGFIQKENWFASRAIMTDFAPDFDLGTRLNYRPTPDWLIRFQLANGWHTLRESNDNKAFSSFIRYDDSRLLVGWGTMITKEPFRQDFLNLGQNGTFPIYRSIPGPISGPGIYSPDPSYERYYSNFFIHHKWQDLWLAFLFDLGLHENGKQHLKLQNRKAVAKGTQYDYWGAASVFMKYFFLDDWAIASRTEYFYDPQAVIVPDLVDIGKGFEVFGETLTLEYAPKKYFLFRVDFRYYRFNERMATIAKDADLADLGQVKALKRDDFLIAGLVAYEFYQLFKF